VDRDITYTLTGWLYTSYILAEELLKLGVHLTGTVQQTRQHMPPELKKKKMAATHDVEAYTTDRIMVLCWQDKRQIMMLSSYHDADVQKVQRHSRKGHTDDTQKPTAIIYYTAKMGAVARADHL